MYYYLVLRITDHKECYDHIVACCPDRQAAEKVISECEEEETECFGTNGQTEAELDNRPGKDILWIVEYEANAINTMHYGLKCYVLRFFSDDPLDYRIVAVCRSRKKAEQLKEEYIKFRGEDDKMRCDRYREELEIVEHDVSY